MAGGIQVTASLDNLGAFERDVLAYFREEVALALRRAAPAIRSEVQALVDAALRNSPEWNSLLSGKLRESFGLAEPQSALEEIGHAVRESVHVEVIPAAQDSLGGLSVAVLRDDFSEVLASRGASYTYQAKAKPFAGKSGGPVSVPWLEWLLFKGDNIVLAGVEINLSRASRGASRTGRAIMVHVGTSRFSTRPSRGWSVPPEFSGVEDANWLTRVLDEVGGDVEGVLEKALAGI